MGSCSRRMQHLTFSHLIELVVEKANCSSNVYSHLSSILDRPTNIKRNESTNPNSRVFLTSVSNNSSKIICPKCLKAHQLHDCPEFRDMPPKQRLEYVKLKGRCFACLKRKPHRMGTSDKDETVVTIIGSFTIPCYMTV